jgi:hypothetical protein
MKSEITIDGYEPTLVLRFNDIEKNGDGLQVIHTA